MPAKSVIALALSSVLLSPAAAWAGPDGDPVCATSRQGCQPEPTTHGGDEICDLDPNSAYCASTVHRVQRGEWLWKIARAKLATAGKSTAPGNVRRIADMIYADNRRIIGENKNRLRVGQCLVIRSTREWPV